MRQPKVSKKSKIARRRGRRPDGTFRKGVNGRRLSKPSPEDLANNSSLSEMILSRVSMKRVADSYIRLATSGGDKGALDTIVKMFEFQKQARVRKDAPDYHKNLTTDQLELFEALLSLAKGLYVSEKVLLERARAVIEELSPAPEVEEDDELESEDVTDEDIESESVDEQPTAPAVTVTLADQLRLGPGDPDRIENRRYQEKLKIQQDRERLYGPLDPDTPPLCVKEYRN
jgi:hypothetical protein